MSDQAGQGKFGCLGTIIVLAFIGFVGARVIPPWLRYEQFDAELRSNARFAVTLPDSMIRIRLASQVDSLGLPPAAKKISIQRHGSHPATITIRSEYDEVVTLPIFGVKKLHFKASAEEPL